MNQVLTEPNPILIALICLATLATAVALFRPKLTLILFFLWVPFADLSKRLLWLPEGVTPSWTEYQLALLLPDLILLGGVTRTAYDLLIARSVRYHPSLLDIPVGLYFLWSFLNIFNPASKVYVGVVGFKSSSLYILIYVFLRLYTTQSTLLQLRTVILSTAGIAAAYTIYQVTWGFSDFELAWLNSGLSELGGGGQGVGLTIALYGIERPFSTFASHEQLGWYLGGALLFLASYNWLKPHHWIVMVLVTAALSRTLSRSAWVFTFAALGAAFVLWLPFRVRAVLIPLIAIPVFFGAGYLMWGSIGTDSEPSQKQANTRPQLDDADSASAKNGESPSTTEPRDSPFIQRATTTGTYVWRTFSFRALLEDATWRTPFGNGTGSMWYAWRLDTPGTEIPSVAEVYELGPTGLPEGKRILSHVGAVDTIYELGIIGMGLFIWTVGAAIFFGLSTLGRTSSKDKRQWILVAIALVVGIVVANSTVTTILIFRPVAALFWLAIGILGIYALNPTEISAAGEIVTKNVAGQLQQS